VLSELLGVSGRLMLRALINGTSTPAQMANLAKRSFVRRWPSWNALSKAGFTDHHRFLLGMQLERVEQVERDIAKLDQRINASWLRTRSSSRV